MAGGFEITRSVAIPQHSRQTSTGKLASGLSRDASFAIIRSASHQ
jgi:hypothetical protein